MTTELSYPSEDDFISMRMMQSRYGDRARLGDEWLEKRKLADKNKLLPDGKPNPLHIRFVLEADMARMAYDMSFMLEQNNIMQTQIGIMSEMYQRVAILEGAYNHVMMVASGAGNPLGARMQALKEAKNKTASN